MPFPIPKIEYRNYTLAGNTSSGSPIITNFTTTANLIVGMFVKGTGIPTGATILSVDSSTQITLDQNATANGTGVSLAFGVEISFDYPPEEPKGETLDSKERVSESISGERQVSVDFIEARLQPTFSFVSETIKLKLDTFVQTWGLYGKKFRYFRDKTTVNYIEYELKNLKYDPKKKIPKGVDTFLWEIPFDFRRVL